VSVLILIIEELVPILALIVYLFVFVLTLKAEEIMPVFAIDSLLDCVDLSHSGTSFTVLGSTAFSCTHVLSYRRVAC